jgi:hypothetical protein
LTRMMPITQRKVASIFPSSFCSTEMSEAVIDFAFQRRHAHLSTETRLGPGGILAQVGHGSPGLCTFADVASHLLSPRRFYV